MITLEDIFEALAYGELSQLAISKAGKINIADQPQVISAINLALTALFSRFPLLEKEVIIQQYAHITEYILDVQYAQSNPISIDVPKYIVDSVTRPFLDDVIRITAAYDEAGKEVTLNDLSDDSGWFTPSYNSIQIPFPNSDNTSVLTYRAKHPKIPLTVSNPATVEVMMHTSLVEALLAYIANRIHTARGGEPAMKQAQQCLAKYEDICMQAELRNLLHTNDSAGNLKLYKGGWV